MIFSSKKTGTSSLDRLAEKRELHPKIPTFLEAVCSAFLVALIGLE
jgi:hypothetical protein